MIDKQNQKIILGIIGSPRHGGNTEIIIDKLFESVYQSGTKYEKIFLNELNILPCQACDVCQTKEECIQKDDFKTLIKKMEQSDIWIMGTPVYYWGPTAQFKIFMDRWYGIEKKLFNKKKTIIVIPLGDGNVNSARYTEGILKSALQWQGVNLLETIIVPGLFKKGEVMNHPEILKQVYKVGYEIIN